MGAKIQSYRDLDAWCVAMDLMVLAYRAATLLPATERYELSSQIRRASTSVPANIAEGFGFGRDGRYIHHLRIALGSLAELGTHLEATKRLGMLTAAALSETEEQVARTGQVLHGLLRARVARRRRELAGRLTLLAGLALGPALLLVFR